MSRLVSLVILQMSVAMEWAHEGGSEVSWMKAIALIGYVVINTKGKISVTENKTVIHWN